MKRRAFITLLGAAAAWPIAARAQQREKVRRIGVLMNTAADDPEGQARMAAFLQGLEPLGWSVGRNAQIDLRWGAGSADRFRTYAAELLALSPDVILGVGAAAVGSLQQASRSVPIVFVESADPVSAGLVASLARPGGNTTGFIQFEYGMSAKWLELLKQIAPRVTRVSVMRDPANPTGIGLLAAIQSVAPALGVELSPIDVRDAGEIERSVAAFRARGSNGGLIVVANASAIVHRDLIISLAAHNGPHDVVD